MATLKTISVLLTTVLLAGLTAFAADPAGKWTAEVEASAGTQKITFEFTAMGSELKGNTTTEQGSIEIQQGKIEGDEITFTQSTNVQGTETRIEYKGTVTDDEIKFQRKVGDAAPQEFVAKRAK